MGKVGTAHTPLTHPLSAFMHWLWLAQVQPGIRPPSAAQTLLSWIRPTRLLTPFGLNLGPVSPSRISTWMNIEVLPWFSIVAVETPLIRTIFIVGGGAVLKATTTSIMYNCWSENSTPILYLTLPAQASMVKASTPPASSGSLCPAFNRNWRVFGLASDNAFEMSPTWDPVLALSSIL